MMFGGGASSKGGVLPPFLFLNVFIFEGGLDLSVRGWLTKNASKVIETTVEQSKQTFATNVGNKTDLYYKLGRIGLLVLLAWLTVKEAGGYLQDNANPKSNPSPTHVVVNNYIYDGKERSKSK